MNDSPVAPAAPKLAIEPGHNSLYRQIQFFDDVNDLLTKLEARILDGEADSEETQSCPTQEIDRVSLNYVLNDGPTLLGSIRGDILSRLVIIEDILFKGM